jgi:transposase
MTRLSNIQRADIVQKRKSGLSVVKLAGMYQVSYQTISTVYSQSTNTSPVKHKLSGRPRVLGSQMIKMLRSDYLTGDYSRTELAEKYGVSKSTVHRNLFRP